MRLLGTVAVSVFFMVSTASATSYYVSTTGNDAASGSIDAPLRTITKAAQVARPGDVVSVRGGTYTDRAYISSKGTAAAPIVFRAMPGETVILDGSNTPSNKGVVELTGTQHVDFSGFEVRNAPYIGIVLWHAGNTRVLDNHVHHTTRNGIYAGGDALGGSYDITVSGNSVHDTVLENQYHNMNGGGWAGAVVVSKTERATITNNRIWNNDGEGIIALRGNHYLVQGNEVFDNFSVNFYLDNARFVTGDRNLIYSTENTRYYRNGLPAAGISIANETKDVMNPSSDNVFTNNIVVGVRWGFHYGNYESGGGLRNTRVLNNTFYGSKAEIVRIEDDAHSNNEIANNIFYQTGSPTPKYTGAGAVTYRNNLWYGGSAGAAAGTGDIIADPLFLHPGGVRAEDYRLTHLSPAIHKALDLGEVRTDFWGSTRTPTYDIGAHEESLSLGSSSPALPALEPPASVTATAQSSNAIQLSWAASAGGTGYRVYRNRSLVATVAGTTWTDSTVSPSTTYSYAVTTIDGSGNESAPSLTASVSTPGDEPSAPGVLTAFADQSGVTLSWQASTDNDGVRGYLIYRDSAVVATVTETSWTDTNVAPSTTYRYAVVAFDAAQNHSVAATTMVTTPAAAKSRGRAVRR
ncbi:MAG TPA: right-handed parallel beta-helix repeat-containing protein [Thermoanaerobaculia bacterium]|nr:right-handed parallel beta-helix repeat-containing protein [Thermoanaerobaculia bacterium]